MTSTGGAKFQLTGIPTMTWIGQPGRAEVDDERLVIAAGRATDWVANPVTGERLMNASALGFSAPDTYMLSARVRPTFAGTFDAGVLMVYQDDQTWAKLCFEFSPEREPMVVSVVTHGMSDDCNSVVLNQDSVHLRVARNGKVIAFHYSVDGTYWHFVRLFAFGSHGAPVYTGFLAQSPTGDGSTARFDQIMLAPEPLADYRSGA